MKTSIDPSEIIGRTMPMVRHTLNDCTMGTRYSVCFYARKGIDTATLASALFAAVDRVDQQMSTWKPASDLNRLNAGPLGVWINLPRELMMVLDSSLQIERASNGAFDIGVGDLVSRWGFGAHGGATQKTVASSAPRAKTCEALELDLEANRARKVAPLFLDLSGIAKGFGVDELARVMVEFAIPAWLVGIDGEMRAQRSKPNGEPWLIAQERPVRDAREVMGVIELTDRAVATSGNYRHIMEVNGKIVSHTMDTRTGAPLNNAVASVTVLAPTCMLADAWATALMVLGPDAGAEFATSIGFQASYVVNKEL